MKLSLRTGIAAIAIASFPFWTSCTKTNHDELSADSAENSGARSGISSAPSALAVNYSVITTVPALCGTPVVKNFIKNTSTYGQIGVGNDATDYYITITGMNGWSLKNVRLYAGTEAGIPVNSGNGLPKHNEFPIQETMSSPYPGTLSLKTAIAGLGDDFWVSVRTEFINASGSTEALWSEGILFSSTNTASKFNYTRQECIVDEGCAYGQGYWFGNGNQSWPDVNGTDDGHVTIGDEHYTRTEARDVWWANNGNCPGIPNAKKAMAFIAAIRLSGSSVIGNANLWDDVATVDAWLETLDKLTPGNICDQPAAPSNVKDAIARIGDWLDAHDCDE